MNKKFLSAVLFGSLFAASTSTFVSCKDYDDDISGLSEDINGLSDRVAAVEKLVNDLQAKIQSGAVITDVTSNAEGIVVTLSNGQKYTVTNGKNGKDGQNGKDGVNGQNGQDGKNGSVVTIGENGNWFIDGVDTGKPSRGEKGEDGKDGVNGEGAEAASSIYYRPGTTGAEAGKWVEVTVNAKGEKSEKVTDMLWRPEGSEKKLTAIWADDELTFTGVEGVEDGTLKVALKNVLKAMVFQPDFVMDGERAMEYLYFPYKAHAKAPKYNGEMIVHDIVSDSNSDNHSTVEKTLNYTVNFTYGAAKNWSYLNPEEIKKYHMDPATAIIPSWWAENQELEVTSDDLDFIHKRTADSNPVAAYFAKVEDGMMLVNIKMDGQKVMNQADTMTGEDGTPDCFAPVDNNTQKITQLAVQAPLKKDKSEMITSTYAAVYASQVGIESIVYEKDNVNIIRTKEYGCENLVGPADHVDPAKGGYHLYATAQEAAENAPTVELAYNNATGINLNELVSTHVLANSERSWNEKKTFFDMNDKKLAEYDMHFEFEQVGFSVGGNGTEETQNHSVLQERADGMYIIACGVDSQSDTDQSAVKPSNDKIASSKASVGRTPLILVKLVNEAGDVMKVGYIKFKIVAPEMPQVTESFDLGNYFYGCEGNSKKITWHAIEDKLLDVAEIEHGQAGTSKATFDALYEVVKEADGSVTQFVENGVDKNGQKKFKNVPSVGTISEVADPGAETTDVFTWEFDRPDFVTMYDDNKAAYPEISLRRYVKYVAKGNLGNTGFNRKPIYLPIDVKFCYPMGIMNNKFPAYWYADNTFNAAKTANDAMDAIHIGVEVPKTYVEGWSAVNDFFTDLDSRFMLEGMGHHTWGTQPNWGYENYTENAPSAKFDVNAFSKPYAWNVLANFADFAQKDLVYYYYFTANNNGKQVKGASGKTYTLSVDYNKAISPVALFDEATDTEVMNCNLYAGGYRIATVRPISGSNPESGSNHLYKFWYSNNSVAQDILNNPENRKNLKETGDVKAFFEKTLDVEIGVAAFNACKEYYPLKDNTFKAEILKPVYQVPGKDVEFWDARDGKEEGTYVNLADLVSFYDWRERDFYPEHLSYYNYYDVYDIAVDVREIKTDLSGEMKPLKETSQDVEFHVVRGGKTYDRELPPTAGTPNVNATWNDLVKHYGKLTYTYNNSTVRDFQIEIPVVVRHAWNDGSDQMTERTIWVKGIVHHSEKN